MQPINVQYALAAISESFSVLILVKARIRRITTLVRNMQANARLSCSCIFKKIKYGNSSDAEQQRKKKQSVAVYILHGDGRLCLEHNRKNR